MSYGACAICAHPFRVVSHAKLTKAGDVLLCHRCYGVQVVITTAAIERLGARTFYVSSFGGGADNYTVKRFRQQMTCNCPDYTHRAQVLGVPCKHVNVVKWLAKASGGYRALAHGVTFRFRLADLHPTKGARRA